MTSLSQLHKTVSRNGDTAAVTTALKQQGRISEDVILILDEILYQKSEKYFEGDTFGTSEDLYKLGDALLHYSWIEKFNSKCHQIYPRKRTKWSIQ